MHHCKDVWVRAMVVAVDPPWLHERKNDDNLNTMTILNEMELFLLFDQMN